MYMNIIPYVKSDWAISGYQHYTEVVSNNCHRFLLKRTHNFISEKFEMVFLANGTRFSSRWHKSHRPKGKTQKALNISSALTFVK